MQLVRRIWWLGIEKNRKLYYFLFFSIHFLSLIVQHFTIKSKNLLAQSHTSNTDTKLKDFRIREAIYV